VGGSEAAGRSATRRASSEIVGRVVFSVYIENTDTFFLHFKNDAKLADAYAIEMRETTELFHIKTAKITALNAPQGGKDLFALFLRKPRYEFIYLSH